MKYRFHRFDPARVPRLHGLVEGGGVLKYRVHAPDPARVPARQVLVELAFAVKECRHARHGAHLPVADLAELLHHRLPRRRIAPPPHCVLNVLVRERSLAVGHASIRIVSVTTTVHTTARRHTF